MSGKNSFKIKHSFRQADQAAKEKAIAEAKKHKKDCPSLVEAEQLIGEKAVVIRLADGEGSVFFRDERAAKQVGKSFSVFEPHRVRVEGKITSHPINDTILYELDLTTKGLHDCQISKHIPPERRPGGVIAERGKLPAVLALFKAIDHPGERQSPPPAPPPPSPPDAQALLTTIQTHGVLAFSKDGGASLFFLEEKVRNGVYDELQQEGQLPMDQPGFRTRHDVGQYTPKGQTIYAIKVKPEFANDLKNWMPDGYVVNKGEPVSTEDRAGLALAALQQTEPRQFVTPPVEQYSIRQRADEDTKTSAELRQPSPSSALKLAAAAAAIPIAAATAHATRSKAANDDNLEPSQPTPPLPPAMEADRALAPDKASPPPAVAPQEFPAYAAYEAYLRSFGNQLRERREQRTLTRDELATRASGILSSGVLSNVVTAPQIRGWEQGKDVPAEAEYEAVAAILIDENATITDKQAARAQFREAYETSRAASVTADERDAFSSRFSELFLSTRIEGKPLTFTRFAELISDRLRLKLPDEEQALLERDKDKFIAGIEAGVVTPSKPLMLALVKVLDASHSLGDDAKNALYDAYAALATAQPPAKLTQISGAETDNTSIKDILLKRPGRKRMRSDRPPDDPIGKIQWRLDILLNPQQLADQELAYKIGVSGATIAGLSSPGSKSTSANGSSPITRELITTYLQNEFPGDGETRDREVQELITQLAEARRAKQHAAAQL